MFDGLYIWVEGGDDEEFIKKIIQPKLDNRYNFIKIIQYAQQTPQWRRNYLKSIQSMKADYIYFADLDSCSCISSKKEEIQQQIPKIDLNKIIIVKSKIEGWYYAGLDQANFQVLRVDKYDKFKITDSLTKEVFQKSCPKNYRSEIDFKQEILKNYNLALVFEEQTNQSLNYLIKKYSLLE